MGGKKVKRSVIFEVQKVTRVFNAAFHLTNKDPQVKLIYLHASENDVDGGGAVLTASGGSKGRCLDLQELET